MKTLSRSWLVALSSVLLLIVVAPWSGEAAPRRRAPAASPAPAVAPRHKEPGSLFAYQAASQYWRRHGSGPSIRIVARNVGQVTLTVQPVRRLPVRNGTVDVEHVTGDSLAPAVHTWTERERPGLKGRWANPESHLEHVAADSYTISGTYVLPLHDDGTYVLTIAAGSQRLRYLYVLSPLGLVVNHTRSVVAGYVFDQKAEKPLANCAVDVWNGAGFHTAAMTGPEGTFRVSLPSPLADRLTVIATDPARPSSPCYYSEGVYGRPFSRDSVYMFTDRPLYRGGHTVYYKATLSRAGAVVAAQPVTLEVRDPSNRLLAAQKTATSVYGSAHGQFTLPPEATAGTYNLVAVWGERRFYETFSVRQYRKPWFEVGVRPQLADLRQGDTLEAVITARAFTGLPLAGATARVTVTAVPRIATPPVTSDDGWESRATPAVGRPREVLAQDVALDAQGTYRLSVKTTPADTDMTYTIAVTAKDAENHTASGSGSVMVTRAGIQVMAWMERDLVAAGEEAPVRLRVTTTRGVPQAVAVRLSLDRGTWMKGSSVPQWTAAGVTGTVTTDAQGNGRWSPRVPSGGYYRLTADATDEAGRATRTQAFFWTSGGTESTSLASLEIIPDRRSYRIGDTARLLLTSGLVDAWAYVSVEGSTVHSQQVVHLAGHGATIEVPVTEALVPGFYVHASIVGGGRYVGGSVALSVPDRSRLLTIQVEKEQEVYRPGQEAVYRVHVRDAAGKPVQTEFSLAVVDEALLALQPDTTPDPRSFFYGRRQNEVTTGYSIPREVTGGAYQNVPSRPSSLQNFDFTRSTFRDTAYWNPVLTTDADGNATVRVRLPDNLTRWKGTVRAVTPVVQVGMATDTLLARKDLMIRLAAPRFFRESDSIVVAAEAQNLTSQAREVTVTLTADGVQVADAHTQRLRLAPRSAVPIRWRLGVAGIPNGAKATLAVQTQTVDAQGALADGERLDIPVRPYGQEVLTFRSWRQTATAEGTTFDDRFVLPAGGGRARVRLSLAPSLAATALAGLEALATYPYGCTEQTMSSFLPDVVLARAVRQLGMESPRLAFLLPRQVQAGLARLYGYQHSDGGWGWWKDDRSDPWMTAYVLHGLSLAQAAGFAVAPDALAGGVDWLSAHLDDVHPTGRAFAARSLALATAALASAPQGDGPRPATVPAEGGSKPLKPVIDGLLAQAEKLDAFGLAMLAEALLAQERTDDARRVMNTAWGRCRTEAGVLAWWAGEASAEGRWGSTDVEATSALLAVAARLDPRDDRIAQVTAWLMQQRSGDTWGTTRSTSLAVMALSEVMAGTRELDWRYTVQVHLNGRPVMRMNFERPDITAPPLELVLPAASLVPGENRVRLEVKGRGMLYASREASAFVQREPLAEARGITVERCWQVRDAKGAWVDTTSVQAGQEVQVVLKLATPSERKHVMLTDALPSGFEVADAEPEKHAWNRRDVLDDHVAFFFTDLPAGGTTITYRGRVEGAGTLHVMPARASMMYLPAVGGQSAGAKLEVRP